MIFHNDRITVSDYYINEVEDTLVKNVLKFQRELR
jgi:hypothetical protein